MKEKINIEYYNASVIDLIQVKVGIPKDRVELVQDIFQKYSREMEIENYILHKEVKLSKVTITSIIKNQLSILQLDKAINILPNRKSENDIYSSIIQNEDFDEEEIDNDGNTYIITLDIKIRNLLNTVKKYSPYNEDTNILNISNSEYKLQSILALIIRQAKIDDNEVILSYAKELIKDNNLKNTIFNNPLKSFIINNPDLMRVNLEYVYVIIILYILSLFNLLFINVLYIRPTEIFISKKIALPYNNNDKPNTGRDIMPTINSVLDFSQPAMELLSGMLSIDKNEPINDILKKYKINYHNGLVHSSYSLNDNNYSSSQTDFNSNIEYRSLYKPHGDGYLDGGYSFFKIDSNVKNLLFNPESSLKMNRISFGNYLNPITYYKYFQDKVKDEFDDPEVDYSIFALTFKVYSVKNKLFNVINKSFVSLIDKSYDKPDRLQEIKIIGDIKLYKYQIDSIFNQLYNIKNKASKHIHNIGSHKLTYYSLSSIINFVLNRMLLDPINILKSKKRNLAEITDFSIRNTVDYFMRTPMNKISCYQISQCIQSINSTIYEFSESKKWKLQAYTIRGLGLNDNNSLRDILNALENPNLYNNMNERINIIDSIIIIIAYALPKNIAILNPLSNRNYVKYLMKLLFLYVSNMELRIHQNESSVRYIRLFKNINQIICMKLLERKYIDYSTFKYLTSNKKDEITNKHLYFNPFDLDTNTINLISTIEYNFKLHSFND